MPFFGCMIVLISCCYKIKVLKNFFKAFLFYLQGCLIILLFIAPKWMLIYFAENLQPNVFVTIVVVSFLICSVCTSLAIIELGKYYIKKYSRELDKLI